MNSVTVMIPESRGVYVGEHVLMMFSILDEPDSKQISEVFLYQNFATKPLPSWITFDQLNEVLTVNVNKEGLGIVMVLLQIKIQITANDFN